MPASAGRLLGRADEVSSLLELLRDGHVRLLTLCGAGGVGKTRLAMEVARLAFADFADGARFVDLASCRDPELVPVAIANSIEQHHAGQRAPLDALERALQNLHLLLVLDNFEQVVDAAPVLADLLAHCPRLVILATSRVALRLTWERQFLVAPLALPEPGRASAPEGLNDVPSVAMLLDRMGRVGVATALYEKDPESLVTVCRRLDGIPLAIELAAARARLLPPRALLERLDRLERPLDLLTDGPRDIPIRHQSLRRTFDWSYELLAESDKTLFRNLGVFVGGFTIDAVARIAAPSSSTDVAVVDALGRLIDSSLVRRAEPDGSRDARLSLLEPIREYALEQLRVSGDEATIRRQHAVAYLEVAELADHQLREADQAEWLARVEREHANALAALEWFVEQGDVEHALRMAAALTSFWRVRGFGRQGLVRLQKVLALPMPEPISPALALARASAHYSAAAALWAHGELSAAQTEGQDALSLYQHLGDQRGCAVALNILGNCALVRGDLAHAESTYAASLDLFGAVDNPSGRALVMVNLALVAAFARDFDRAHTLLADALLVRRQIGDTRGVAFTLATLGVVDCYRGNFESAQVYARDSMNEWKQMRDLALLPMLIENCATVAAATRDNARALRLGGAAAALREELAAPSAPIWAPEFKRWLDGARASLGEPASTRAWQEGLALDAAGAVAEALRTEPMQVSVTAPTEKGSTPPGGLTVREVEVLRLLAAGDTNKEIAARLVLSVATVERHIANVYVKIGARGRAEATAFAISGGLLQPPPSA
jgi:predicted ATPase/DNA-binding CsgD family transcriptional regulator